MVYLNTLVSPLLSISHSVDSRFLWLCDTIFQMGLSGFWSFSVHYILQLHIPVKNVAFVQPIRNDFAPHKVP